MRTSAARPHWLCRVFGHRWQKVRLERWCDRCGERQYLTLKGWRRPW